MTTLIGEVLGERTVLNFPHQTDNSGGNHVMQQHTGRADHATAYQKQLQFSLCPTLEHAHSTIINHPPRPPPVVIERLPPKAKCLGTQDRLEMAALVARRDFKNGRIPAQFLSAEQSESDSSSEEGDISEASEQVLPIQPPKVAHSVEAVKFNVPPVLSKESHFNVKSQEKDSNIDKMASEIVSLRRQLRRQVSRLREAVYTRKTSKITFEDEDDIERELRREDGRSIRSMQSLYSLQQQVQKLKSDLDKHQKVSTAVRDTKKSLAMKQLAATHRSAIRLLHSFTGMSSRPAVYQQLSELMQQLTLCCCQLGLDGTQLLELNDQMKALENEIVELNKNEEELATVTRLKQQVQPTRKPTRTLPQRQQRHRNLVSVQPSRRSGHFKAQTFSSLMRKQTPPGRRKAKLPSPSRKQKHRNAPPKLTSPPPPIKLRPSAAKRAVKPTETRQPTITIPKKRKSKQKRKGLLKKQQYSDHKDNETIKEVLPIKPNNEGDKRDSSNEGSSCDSESSIEDVASLVNTVMESKNQLLSSSTPRPTPSKPSSGHHDNNSMMMPVAGNESSDETPKNLETLQTLQEMLVRMSHIEEEKMRIQQRWNSLTYRDASIKPLVHMAHHPSPCSTMTPSVSPSVLQSVSHYRDRFHHHLKLKGAITGLDWESSKLIEKMSEEILDEIVESTVNELDQLCEHYAHNIFASEFAVPNSST